MKEKATAMVRIKPSTIVRLHKVRVRKEPIMTLAELIDELSKMKMTKID